MNERLVISAETGEVVGEMSAGDRILRQSSEEHFKKINKSEFKGRSFIKVDTREGLLLVKELTPSEKSALFTLQYYVSYESGIIQYPNGKDICFEDMCKLMGFSREKTSAVISSLIAKDILYKGKNSRKSQYFMNPWVASKGVAPNPTLKEMFKNYQIRSKGNMRWRDLE